MKEWIETLKDELYSQHVDPVTITENEGRKLITEIEQLEAEALKRYTVKEFLTYCDNNGILLVDADSIGNVELPLVTDEYIYDDDKDGLITPSRTDEG